MGVRIAYHRNNDGKTLKELLIENFEQFREWYLQQEKICEEEYNVLLGSEHTSHYLVGNEYISGDFGQLDKKLVDELTSAFLAIYLDSSDTSEGLLELVGPCMNKRRYQQSSDLVSATNDHEFVRLWNYIINGRSLKDGDFFDSYTNDYKIGYLSINETRLLKEKIEKYLSNTDFSPQNEGLELVLEAISHLDERNAELIVGIDMA